MSDKEDNEGEIVLHHPCHMHPLILTITGARTGKCNACSVYISPTETAYTCSLGFCYNTELILHEDCAEMPQEITLSSHPQHSLIQRRDPYGLHLKCAVCEMRIYWIGYYCSSSYSCQFVVHLICAHDFIIWKSSTNEHPSHPHHHLTLLRKSISFKCDACGVMHEGRGKSYICNDCQYWIHESCTALPPTRDFRHLHHHPLSLAYRVPPDYIRFDFKCRICFMGLLWKNWVYHCGTCRYVVHINCTIHNNSDML